MFANEVATFPLPKLELEHETIWRRDNLW